MLGHNRESMLKLIEQNIIQFGYHVYVVRAGTVPRFVYTIGLSEGIGAELVLAGSIQYTADNAKSIIELARQQLEMGGNTATGVKTDDLGDFLFREVHPSWVDCMLLGAVDYYKNRRVNALQLVPDDAHMTSDVPNLSRVWNDIDEPVWQWLRKPWPYPIPPHSAATTNLAALKGARITEIVRWEEDEWEMFAGAGPDVDIADMRIVPLGSLMAIDPSLLPVVSLDVGSGLWRSADDDSWNSWVDTEDGKDSRQK